MTILPLAGKELKKNTNLLSDAIIKFLSRQHEEFSREHLNIQSRRKKQAFYDKKLPG